MPDTYGQQLADWGKIVMLETTGRVNRHRTAVGFGRATAAFSWRPAAGTDWAANLRAEPASGRLVRRARVRAEARRVGRARAITG
jgi:hypothetical protein